METNSTTHRLQLDEETGTLTVWQLAERQLHITEFRDGVKVKDGIETDPDPATARLLEAANRQPLFVANFAGDGSFNVDIDCGFQRWNGVKGERDVRTALRRCGFAANQVKAVVAATKVEEHAYVGRCW
jgi:hypothetical protein